MKQRRQCVFGAILLVSVMTNIHAAPPTISEVQAVKQEKNVIPQVNKLLDIVNRAEGNFFDTAMQNEFAGLLDHISYEYVNKDAVLLKKLADLVQKSVTTPLLTPEQQNYVANTLQPMIQNALIRASRKRGGPGEPDAASATTQLVSQYLDAASKKSRFIEKVATLQQLLGQAQNQTFSTSDQNRFAQQLSALFKKRPPKDTAAIAALENLASNAAKSSLLSPRQQQYVVNVMLKTMKKEKTKERAKPAVMPRVAKPQAIRRLAVPQR